MGTAVWRRNPGRLRGRYAGLGVLSGRPRGAILQRRGRENQGPAMVSANFEIGLMGSARKFSYASVAADIIQRLFYGDLHDSLDLIFVRIVALRFLLAL